MGIDDEVLLSVAEEAALRAEIEQHERLLYGSLLSDVKFMRSRDFTIWRVGKKLNVDGKILTVAQFKEKAARERRMSKQ